MNTKVGRGTEPGEAQAVTVSPREAGAPHAQLPPKGTTHPPLQAQGKADRHSSSSENRAGLRATTTHHTPLLEECSEPPNYGDGVA